MLYDEKINQAKDNPLVYNMEMQIFAYHFYLNKYGSVKNA